MFISAADQCFSKLITDLFMYYYGSVFYSFLFNFFSEYHMIDNYFEGPLVMIFTDLIMTIDNKVCKQQAQLSVMKV